MKQQFKKVTRLSNNAGQLVLERAQKIILYQKMKKYFVTHNNLIKYFNR
jgi:hypothetical protein